MEETELGLLVPVGTDAPKGPEQIGENAKRTNALLQKGGVGAHAFVEEATRASTALGAFTTPLACELPKVKAGQIVDVYAMGYFLKGTGVTFINFQVGGNAVSSESEVTNEGGKMDLMAFTPLAAGGVLQGIFSRAANQTESEAKTAAALMQASPAVLPYSWHPVRIDKDRGPLKFEIVGKAASGTMKLIAGVIAAHVRA